MLIGICGPLATVWMLRFYDIEVKLPNPMSIAFLLIIGMSEVLFFSGFDRVIVDLLTKGCPL
jgi:hypothetical protein